MFRRIMAHVRRQPVAFVALFFALTGSAFAGTKYLAAGDGTLHGHLADSAYGYRLSANGAVTHPAHRGRPPGRPRRVRGATPGLPDVFATSMVSPVRLGEDGRTGTTVLVETNLPAGNYLVNAKTSVLATAAPLTVSCGIFASPGGVEVDHSDATLENVNSEESIPLQATIRLTSGSVVSLGCSASTGHGGDVSAQFSQLNLTEVGLIN